MANKILEGAQEGFENLTQTLDSTAKKYLSLEKIIPDVIDLFSQQASDVRMLNKELGNGSKLTADFRKEIINISKSIGIASKDTIRLVEATKEYHQGITASTEATLKFQKASGVSIGIIGKFAAKVNILGNISAKTHNKMYENILAVRDAYGLTDEQIGDVVVSLTNYAVATQASDEQILKASVSLSKFTSLLTSAGIEADRVATILDNMLDPDRMMDNVVLMNRMGITINDMVSGDPTAKLEEGVVKLKELGQEIASIAKNNRLQASEIAKVYNLTLQEAIQLSELDTSEKALNTQKKLDEYRNEIASLIESLGAFKESVIGYAASLINPLLKGFEKLEGKMGLMSKGLIGLGTILVSKWVLGKFRDGILSLFGEAARKFSNEMANYLGKVDNRMGTKNADVKNLAPKRDQLQDEKYGFGFNWAAKAERRRTNLDLGRFNRSGKIGTLSTGEFIESFQSRIEKLNELAKYADMLEKQGRTKELVAFQHKYASKKALENQAKKLSGILSRNNYGETLNTKISDYKVASDKNKSKASHSMIEEFLNQTGLKIGFNDSDGSKKAFTEAISGSDNLRQVLEKMADFYKEKGLNKELEETTKALDNMNNEIKKTYDSSQDAIRDYKKSGEMVGERGGIKKLFDGLGNRFGSFFKGLKTDLITGILKIPGNLLKGLKFGALGLLGGVGVKFMASLSKNEKFQESMATISEKISTMFDGLVATIEPVIEPLSKAVIGLFNLLQPAIDWLGKILGKIAGWFGGVLNKSVSSISQNVSTISDSYKQEDLKTMIAAKTIDYNQENDSLTVQVGKVISVIEEISKKVDDNTLAQIAK